MSTDYYELLGVSRTATPDELKRAYRRRARELHPDTNPDPDAEARFKEVATAYEVLADPEKRQRYDRFGPDGVNGGGGGDPFGFGGGSFSDIFDAFFGGGGGAGFSRGGRPGPQAGSDLEVAVDIAFTDAVFGTQAPVEVRTAVACETCEATGAAPGTAPSTCPDCQGAGQVRRVRQTLMGQMVSAGLCTRCGGQGEVVASPCPTCHGEGRQILDKTYTVDIPAGVDTGSTLRLSGLGAAGPRGGGHGDLYVHVRVRGHDRFERQGDDLHHDLHLPATQAALGAEIPFATLDGTETLRFARGTHTGHRVRLRGKGVPHVQGRGRGDLLVSVVVDPPSDLTEEQEELLRRLAELRGEEVAAPDAGLMSKIRSAFK